jgi:hypothetical protein
MSLRESWTPTETIRADDRDPNRPFCDDCNVGIWLFRLKQTFAGSLSSETRIYQCKVCQAQKTINFRALPALAE